MRLVRHILVVHPSKMKILNILFCIITITTALVERRMIVDLLEGKAVTLSAVEVNLQVGSLPALYQPLTSTDQSVANKTTSFAEYLRKFFPKGLGNIPPLDPYQPFLDHIPLTFLEPLVSGDIRLHGVKITGAQKFKIEDLALRLKYGGKLTREDAEVSLPSLQVVTGFDLNVLVTYVVRVRLTGTFIAELSDVKVKVAGGTYLTELIGQDRVQFNAVKANARAGHAQLKAQFDDPIAARLAIAGVPNQSKLDKMEIEVEEAFLHLTLKEINKALSTFTAKQLRDLLGGPE